MTTLVSNMLSTCDIILGSRQTVLDGTHTQLVTVAATRSSQYSLCCPRKEFKIGGLGELQLRFIGLPF